MSALPQGFMNFCREQRVWLVWGARLVVGVTFIVSGMAKLIDPWGFIYKIEDYLAVWQWAVPRTLELSGAIFLSAMELSMGALLLLGCFRRVITWLLAATMAFMLPLTLYIWLADPVADCGCFGDLLVISNGATFAKNLVLTALIIYLIPFNCKVKALYHPQSQWVVATLLGAYSFTEALIGYNIQPMIDFRPFPVGTDLSPEEDEEENVAFIYEKDGVTRQFGVDELPDSTWTFVDRVESESTQRSVNEEFTLFQGDEDVTYDVLDDEGTQLLLLVPDMRRLDISFTYLINEINDWVSDHDGEMIGVLGTDSRGVQRWEDFSMAQYPCYSAEDTRIKELVRGNTALVLLQDGKVQWKRNFWSVPSDVLSREDPLGSLNFDGPYNFWILTSLLLVGLLLLWAVQNGVQAAYRRLTRRKS